MGTIRTEKLSSGLRVATGVDTFTLYTVPAGYHVRMRRATFMFDTTGRNYVAFLEAPSGNGVLLIPAQAGGSGVPFGDAGDHVLEAGDLVRVNINGAGQYRWWLSGTVYENG